MEFPKLRGTLFGVPYNKDYNIEGSRLDFSYLCELPNTLLTKFLGRAHAENGYSLCCGAI